MGIWDDLKTGLHIIGGTIESMATGAFKTLGAAASGFASGGPLGAISAAVPAGINAVSGLVNRIHSYSHPVGENGMPTPATVASVIAPTGIHKTVAGAMNAVTAQSPPSVMEMAGAGARYMDGLAKHGDGVAAGRAAGGTPLTEHLGNSLSSHISDVVKARTGFDSRMALMFGDSAFREAQMLPTTSAYSPTVLSYMRHGGAEALAMRHLSRTLANPVNREIVVGGG